MKITFITYHNWETKRIGGFHKFAKACAEAGHEVVFFSFERPYYIALKKEERLNYNVLKSLTTGINYHLNDSKTLINCTWPTLRIPQPLYRLLPKTINKFFNLHSLIPYKKFQDKFLKDTDVFVFESNGLEIFDLIKKHNPKALLIYRPSDPIMVEGCSEEEYNQELKLMLNVDYTFLVNKSGLDLYRKRIKKFDDFIKYEILSNGVDTIEFTKSYPRPKILNLKNTFLYVGARVIEWNLILSAAKERPEYNFIIVCPENPPKDFISNRLSNLHYINGIPANEVPMWVTNCDVIIVPNPKDWYKIKPWGITAKYYQAMVAKKPIVVFDDTDELLKYGILVSHTYQDFLNSLDLGIKMRDQIEYKFIPNDWNHITTHFLNRINELYQEKNKQ